jgi:hypothetical protein
MLNTSWNKDILAVLRQLADERYQRESWFQNGPFASSPDEMMCQLFDDLLIEKFYLSSENDMSVEARCSGQDLVSALANFRNETPNHLIPDEIIDDPRWKEIRKLAGDAAAKLAT